MKVYCDMDGVLVRQTGSDGFDRMPWMPDGRELWDFIAPMNPTILSQRPDDNWARTAPQKVAWVARELGPNVPVIIARRSVGKSPHAQPGAILIDDGLKKHGTPWIERGGIFIHHRSAKASIKELQRLIGEGALA